MSQMDNFESLEDELAPITQILSGDNEKNPSFSHIMSKVLSSLKLKQDQMHLSK